VNTVTFICQQQQVSDVPNIKTVNSKDLNKSDTFQSCIKFWLYKHTWCSVLTGSSSIPQPEIFVSDCYYKTTLKSAESDLISYNIVITAKSQ